MGLFDSCCALTGLSLAPLRVAAIPLRRGVDGFVVDGAVQFGTSDRLGGLAGDPLHDGVPVRPERMLVAAQVYDALVAGRHDLNEITQALGRAVMPSVADGSQHGEGTFLFTYTKALRAAHGIPWLTAAIEACGVEASQEALRRLGRDAPPQKWLTNGYASAYAVVVGTERFVCATPPGVVRRLGDAAGYAFDTDTLTRAATADVGVWVVQRGEWTFVDLQDVVAIVDGPRSAPLSDPEGSSALFEVCEEPAFVVDEGRLAALLPPLVPPLLPPGEPLYAAVLQGLPPRWDSTQRYDGVVTFGFMAWEEV